MENLEHSNLLKLVCLLVMDTWAWIFITSLSFDIGWAISGTIVSPIFWNWIVTLTISFAISPSTRNWAFFPVTESSPTTVYFKESCNFTYLKYEMATNNLGFDTNLLLKNMLTCIWYIYIIFLLMTTGKVLAISFSLDLYESSMPSVFVRIITC